MTPHDGFVDLRLNRQEGQNQDSFWPSFTDIMTVIVMIFLIAMVVLLLRNIELVKQLRATMEAERHAMELARSTGEEKESLALKLIAAENDLAMLRIKLMRVEEESKTQALTIGEQSQSLAELKSLNQDLILRRDQLSAENFSLSEKLKTSQTTINRQKHSLDIANENLQSTRQQLANTQQVLAATQADLSELQAAQNKMEQQLADLSSRFSIQSSQLIAAQASERSHTRNFKSLRKDYDELKVKYDKLVRPARSPAGRFVVEIRYTKIDGAFRIEFQTQENQGYQEVEQAALDAALEQLKKEKKNGLYIKLIFPEDSGLSFNEAWSITTRLHGKYDYYHQSATDLIPLVPIPRNNQE